MSFVADLFAKPKLPDPIQAPSRADPAVAEARRRELAIEAKSRGPGANYLTGGTPVGAAPVSQKYLTGS